MQKTIKVNGMTCQHCVMHVKNALLEINGVSQVDIDLETSEVTIEQTTENNLHNEFVKAVTEAGYSIA